MAAEPAAARLEEALPSSRRPSQPRPARRARPRSRLTGGVLWIVGLAVLLAGVVAVNVGVLRLNMRYDELARNKAGLIAQNAELSSELSRAAATGRIEQLAHTQLGLVPASPDRTRYVHLDR